MFKMVNGVRVQMTAQEEADFLAASVPPSLVPQSVTPRQARLALSAAGLLGTVNDAVAVSDDSTRISWEYATEVRRDNPLIAQVASGLNLTDAQIDALFVSAASL